MAFGTGDMNRISLMNICNANELEWLWFIQSTELEWLLTWNMEWSQTFMCWYEWTLRAQKCVYTCFLVCTCSYACYCIARKHNSSGEKSFLGLSDNAHANPAKSLCSMQCSAVCFIACWYDGVDVEMEKKWSSLATCQKLEYKRHVIKLSYRHASSSSSWTSYFTHKAAFKYKL